MNILWIDLETSGLSVCYDRIVQIAVIYKGKSQTLLINPEVEIPSQATAVHHIHQKDVINAPKFGNIAPKLMNMIEDCEYIGGYNIDSFDLPMLYCHFLRLEMHMPKKPTLDIFKMVKLHEGSKKLKDVYARYIGKELKGAHDASIDTQGCKEVYEYLIKQME